MLAFLKLVPWWVWLVLAWILFAGVQTVRVHHLSAEVVSYQVSAKTYKSAQAINLATIDTLQRSNAQWTETYKARLALAQSYISANIQYQNQLQSQLSAARKQLGAVYATDPKARAWANQRVPDAVSEQLRAAASGQD